MTSATRTGLLIIAAVSCGVIAIVGWREQKGSRAARASREAEPTEREEAPPSYAMPAVGARPLVPDVEPARERQAAVALGALTAAPSSEANAPSQPPPSPEGLPGPERAEALAVRRALDVALLRNPGASVSFIDCADEPCVTRVKAADPRVLHAVASDVSAAYHGHASITLREHLDGFLGRWFEADLTVGTTEASPVPTLEAELPGAVPSPPEALTPVN